MSSSLLACFGRPPAPPAAQSTPSTSRHVVAPASSSSSARARATERSILKQQPPLPATTTTTAASAPTATAAPRRAAEEATTLSTDSFVAAFLHQAQPLSLRLDKPAQQQQQQSGNGAEQGDRAASTPPPAHRLHERQAEWPDMDATIVISESNVQEKDKAVHIVESHTIEQACRERLGTRKLEEADLSTDCSSPEHHFSFPLTPQQRTTEQASRDAVKLEEAGGSWRKLEEADLPSDCSSPEHHFSFPLTPQQQESHQRAALSSSITSFDATVTPSFDLELPEAAEPGAAALTAAPGHVPCIASESGLLRATCDAAASSVDGTAARNRSLADMSMLGSPGLRLVATRSRTRVHRATSYSNLDPSAARGLPHASSRGREALAEQLTACYSLLGARSASPRPLVSPRSSPVAAAARADEEEAVTRRGRRHLRRISTLEASRDSSSAGSEGQHGAIKAAFDLLRSQESTSGASYPAGSNVQRWQRLLTPTGSASPSPRKSRPSPQDSLDVLPSSPPGALLPAGRGGRVKICFQELRTES